MLGNALVLLTVWAYEELQVPANLLLVSLAVADFLTGVFIQPIMADTFYRGITDTFRVCSPNWQMFAELFGYITITASVSTLVLITMDRFIAIIYSLQYVTIVTHERTRLVIALAWVFSV
ncbi:predicted protein, partial [Nematostella vectensis]